MVGLKCYFNISKSECFWMEVDKDGVYELYGWFPVFLGRIEIIYVHPPLYIHLNRIWILTPVPDVWMCKGKPITS